MFTKGRFYKHHRFHDVCFEVKSSKDTPKGQELDIYWFHYKHEYAIDKDRILVPYSQMNRYDEVWKQK